MNTRNPNRSLCAEPQPTRARHEANEHIGSVPYSVRIVQVLELA
jgi:hypothetical protein